MPISAPGNKNGGHTTRHPGLAPVRVVPCVPAKAGTRSGLPPSRERNSAGFTLIELMIVVVVIALASAVAVLALPDPRGRVLDEGARFAVRVRAARDGAIVEARPTSVWVTPRGYGFDRWEAGRWIAIDDKPLRATEWGRGTTVAVPERSRVTFDTTGAADRPVTIPLLRERARATVTIYPDGTVNVDG